MPRMAAGLLYGTSSARTYKGVRDGALTSNLWEPSSAGNLQEASFARNVRPRNNMYSRSAGPMRTIFAIPQLCESRAVERFARPLLTPNPFPH